ncbi:unnamed protein product [Paramecium octaurelia]|uniref:Uncharacterized protein n=1 Tax=Paramecium octaurelia TaxID=43137 RepID=A0A8S1X6I7_PAROT|nr:unnamed protein product [Paramecium octaurelia]
MEFQELEKKYEELEEQWKQSCSKVQSLESQNLQLVQQLNEQIQEISNLKKKDQHQSEEIQQLNEMVTDQIKQKKQNEKKYDELEKKYAKLKEEYKKLATKLENRDLQIQQQEKEYKSITETTQRDTQALISTYEQKITILEQTQIPKQQQSQNKSIIDYLKLFLISQVAHPIFYIMYSKKQ